MGAEVSTLAQQEVGVVVESMVAMAAEVAAMGRLPRRRHQRW